VKTSQTSWDATNEGKVLPVKGDNLRGAKLILFGGKGGVGKTTCASASAVQLADAGLKTLLFSTDPAHSLSDCLEQKIGPGIQAVVGAKNLSAVEVDAERLFLQFKEEYGDDIRRILETSTYLDEADIDDLFSVSIPGLDEVMGFKELVDLMEEGEYDLYIMDTAPTGHALHLLALPELLDQWIRILARIRYKYRYMVSRFSGREVHEAADDFLFTMKRAVKRVQSLLRDPDRCEFVVVTIPEAMAIAETRRLMESLVKFQIPLRHLIINRVASLEHRNCDFCHERWRDQRGYLREVERSFSFCDIFKVLEQPHQVKGISMFRELRFPINWFYQSLVAGPNPLVHPADRL